MDASKGALKARVRLTVPLALTMFVATIGLIVATVAGHRSRLWVVVHDLCLPAYRSIGLAFPCAEVNIANGVARMRPQECA
jgi:CDP-diacylglycerol pyrophosphatase